MQATGVTLNVMTLGGLAVAVGRVVDDAIVVLENIYRHRALGESRLRAVIEGTEGGRRAITAATVTTVGVFLPLGFVGGLVSQIFLPFALTVTFALLASLVCGPDGRARARLPAHRQGQAQRGRGRGAEELALDPAYTPHQAGPAQPHDKLAVLGSPRAVHRHRPPGPAPAHGVHQRGLGEPPVGHRGTARRHEQRGGPGAHAPGRGALAADPTW